MLLNGREVVVQVTYVDDPDSLRRVRLIHTPTGAWTSAESRVELDAYCEARRNLPTAIDKARREKGARR